jgi:hypothetical protein
MDRLCCPWCGDVIGVYEPMRVSLGDGIELTGSSLTLRSKLETPGTVAVHERCHEPFDRARSQGRADANG